MREPNFNLKIRILRTHGSQANFALAVQEHESYVSMVIQGRRHLSPERAEVWARCLNLDMKEMQHILRR